MAENRIVEVKREGTEKAANMALEEGWDLFSVVGSSGGLDWILVKREA